jgi:hypothetical protein
MTRPLLLVFAFGLLSSIVFFAIANALVHGWNWRAQFRPLPVPTDGPEVSRTLAWPGGDALVVDVDAEVDYTQGTVAKVVVTGPKGAVDHLVLRSRELAYDQGMWGGPRLQVTMVAPDVSKFTLNGSQSLKIDGYDHPTLELAVHGSGDVAAKGRTDRVKLMIAGSGDADLAGVTTGDADVMVAGSGDATVSPRDSAEVLIAGSGDVTLTTHPPQVKSRIAGSGTVIQAPAATS